MKKKATLLVLAAAIVLVAVILINNEPSGGIEEGQRAEDFTLPMHERDEGSLSDYNGNVIILNMWASWCKPCIDEMPDLMDLEADYQGQGLSVLAVNMQTFERTLTDAPEFIEKHHITLPVFFDEEGLLAERYQIKGMPTTFVLERDGTIARKIEGEINYEMLESIVKPLLEED